MSIPKLNGKNYNDTLFEFKNLSSAHSRSELDQDVSAAYYKPKISNFNRQRPSIGRQMRDLVTMPQSNAIYAMTSPQSNRRKKNHRSTNSCGSSVLEMFIRHSEFNSPAKPLKISGD